MAGRSADFERARAGMAQTLPDAVILSDWESITPLWYAQRALGLNPTTKTALVTAPPGSDRWVVAVQRATEDRPVVLAQRTPALDGTFRSVPDRPALRGAERPRSSRRATVGLRWPNRTMELLSYRLDRPTAAPGDLVRLTLYQSAGRTRQPDYLPVLRLASNPPVEIRFDGLLHYGSNDWYDNEVVGEVYAFSLPAWLPAGPLPLALAYRDAERVNRLRPDARTSPGPLDEHADRPGRQPSAAAPDALASFGEQLQLRSGRAEPPAAQPT